MYMGNPGKDMLCPGFHETVVEGGIREFCLPFLPLSHLQWRG